MKTVTLSSNQYLKLYHGDAVRVKRDGQVYYIEETRAGLSVTDWSGKECGDVTIKYDGEVLK
jgi:hypothetical protein